MTYVDRELKQDLYSLYESWKNTTEVLGSARILSKMISIARLLGVNSIKDEEVMSILEKAVAYSIGISNPRGIPALLMQVDSMITRLKYELLKKGKWGIKVGESEKTEFDEEEFTKIKKIVEKRIGSSDL